MSRADFVALLADLVERKVIAESEAVRLLVDYDQDDIDALASLPAAPAVDHNDWWAALALLLLLLRRKGGQPIPPLLRGRARTLLRGRFQLTLQQAAQGVSGGKLSAAAWMAKIQAALVSYTLQMAIAGAGQLPNTNTQNAIGARLAQQWPYLRRFALTIAVRGALQRPLSAPYIASRAGQYGRTGWGAFFVGQGQNAAVGVVEQWITRDDRNVCRLCAPRHLQYYLPGQGPMPGDCLGICRCVRVPVYQPSIYAQLTGQPVTP